MVGDGTAVEVGGLVLLVHSDQPVHESVARRGALQGSVLLLIHRLRFGVLATFPRQEVVPNFSIFRGTCAVPAQLCSRVFSVSPGEERSNSSASSSRAVSRGVLSGFGACCFGTNAGNQPGSVGSGL